MSVVVRPMLSGDLGDADRVFRRAFGTFFGLPEPASFRGDSELVRTRFATDPAAAFVAEDEGRIVGSVNAMHWGSLGVLGPLVVDPDAWGRGIARALVPPVLEVFARRGIRLAALLTHPQSPKHLRLYEAFGFELGSTVAVMAKEAAAPGAAAADVERLSALGATAREEALSGCRALTTSLYDGLDLGREIAALAAQRLGDVILLGTGGAARKPGTVAGFALC
ncbi:MAG: GNAT family N-acetyltransferase, partial [Alphaproteobacteria bacterium]